MSLEFEKLFEKLRGSEPSEAQMQKWKVAVGKKQQHAGVKENLVFFWPQIIAALFAGVLIGGLLFGDLNLSSGEENQQIAYEDATIEVVYTKL